VASSSPTLEKHERISDLLRHLKEEAARAPTITVGHILHVSGLRGFAVLLLILSTLNIVIFMIPMLSFFLGLPMVILAAQMVIGFHAPLFPAFIRRRSLACAPLVEGLTRAIYWIEKIERYIKPRLIILSAPIFLRVHALLTLMLAILVTLPIPIVNVPPSIGIFFLAIGLLQRDGLFILLAYIVAIWCFILFRSLAVIAHVVTKGSH
jgi:hypothetical protein